MNRNGVFCFLIVLAFAGMQISIMQESVSARHRLAGARAVAVEAEQLNLIKTAIEVNLDRIIEQTMHEALLQNKEPDSIKSSVNEKLLQFFGAVQEAYAATAEISFYANYGSLSLGFLNENSKVNVSKLDNQSITAEYSFTGGLLKNKWVAAEITGEMTGQLFKMPVGYTARTTVVG